MDSLPLELLWVIACSTGDNRRARRAVGCDLRGAAKRGGPRVGAITKVGSELYVAEAADADQPDRRGKIFIVDPTRLACDPPLDR